MKLLLLNTCGAQGTVALADTSAADPIVATEHLPGRGSSEQVLPAMRRLFKERSWKVSDLDALAVVHGPGSFTGVRVGLSVAKGLCEAAEIPLLAISRLALLAAAATGIGEIVALLDGGRGEFYAGLNRGSVCLSEDLLRHSEVVQLLQNPTRLAITCEPGAAERWPDLNVQQVEEPGPREILLMALERLAAGALTNVASIDANYLRRTDAELLVARRYATTPA